MTGSSLEIRLLGKVQVRLAGSLLPLRAPARTLELLGYLLLGRERALRRDSVAFALWPDLDEATARTKLRTHLHYLLNRILPPSRGAPCLLVDRRTIQWNPDVPVWLDVEEFARLAELPAGAEHAIGLYAGDLLADFDEEWIEAPRTRLREKKAALLISSIETKRASGDFSAAAECARHLLEDDPWREDVVRALMSLLVASGNRAGAIHAFLDFRQRLKAELGGEPMADTTALYERMSVDPVLRGGGAGSFRLRNNLPAPLAPLIAREKELADIEALLAESRLVTVTGCGGIGKTRTAVEAGSHLLHAFDDGVWLVELASLDDPSLVPSAIAAVFNVSDAGESRPLIDRIASTLAEKRLLIVLDNCEHVVAAAAGAVERLLQCCPDVRVLATSRQSLGAAGEEQYRLPSLSVPPAGENPSAALVMEFGAVVLFAARAKSAQRSFTVSDANAGLVAGIVRRLDGIALAIEMAAARVAVLSLAHLARRLDDRFALLSGGARRKPPRHETLRALIAWSYDLLDEPERKMFRWLGVFRGNFRLEAAEEICTGDRSAKWDALGLISSLVDKSLVAVEVAGDELRYVLLESMREFALERLDEQSERHVMAARHCRYFVTCAHRADQAYWYGNLDQWCAHVRLDLENYRAAIAWGLADGDDAASAAAIIGSLRFLWFSFERSEGYALLERAAGALPAHAPSRTRALLTFARSWLSLGSPAGGNALDAFTERTFSNAGDETLLPEALVWHSRALRAVGRVADSTTCLERALATARLACAPRLTGWILGAVASRMGNGVPRARELWDEAEAVLAACGDEWKLSVLRIMHAEFTFNVEGDAARALAINGEAAAHFRLGRHEVLLCTALLNATAYEIALGRLDAAWSFAREALELALQAHEPIFATMAIEHLAHVAARTGDPSRAAKLLGYSECAYRRLTIEHQLTEQNGYDRALDIIRTALVEDRVHALMMGGAAMEQDAAVAEALAIPPPAPFAGAACLERDQATM